MSDSETKTDGARHLTVADFQSTLMGTNQPVMVDFFAHWCGPCQMAAPVIDKLAKEYAGQAIIAKLDVDENGEIAQQYGVMSIPTVIIFKKSPTDQIEIIDRQVGFPGEEGYRQMLEKALKVS
ncbi:MAG TPA: thioredoxin [Candidatus Pacebacteria bacterium]|nr:thioredoxin [Candidatus Paceibacterota bacterium]